MASMSRRPTTLVLSEDVLERAAKRARRERRSLDDVVEDALVEALARRAIAEARAEAGLTEEEALGLAYSELADLRAERRTGSEPTAANA
jgi:predicted transcriptional regulator